MLDKTKEDMRRELQQAIVNTGGKVVTDEKINDTRSMIKFLVSKMTDIASGNLDSAQSTGICNFAQQIYNMKNMELRTALALQKLGTDNKIGPVKFDE